VSVSDQHPADEPHPASEPDPVVEPVETRAASEPDPVVEPVETRPASEPDPVVEPVETHPTSERNPLAERNPVVEPVETLRVEATPIPGLLVVRMPVHADARGWFKENWQREKMTALGLPDFGPVQNNVSFNKARGATRGIHTEPWDKFVSVATGRVFAAWVDMREGDSFGTTFSIEIGPEVGVYVPRGVGNSYQALEDDTCYTYLVNDHWRPGITYPALALDDPTAAIDWPIPLDRAEVSEKDRNNPRLEAVRPVSRRRPLIIGAGGQLGRALHRLMPDARAVTRDELDLADPASLAAWPWGDHDLVVNAAAWTAVDAAESDEGRVGCWAANAHGPAQLARLAAEHRFTLVHYSSDYVFDGSRAEHTEDEPFSPLGVYGQAKAAGDLAVMQHRAHYILRTAWVIGEGSNFVSTMAGLAERGVSAAVVDDQVGRMTFADELARATRHLLESGAPYGTYNVSNAGEPGSWAQIAQRVFVARGRDAGDVDPVSTDEYGQGRVMAPRPLNSVFDLSRLRATGFEPRDQWEALDAYLASSSPSK